MAGEFTAGFSGGQRKMLLFELIYQRTLAQKNLLICLDEPFAGVTDDFVPFLTDRLNKMRENHNILLVTNDHVTALSKLSDNVITVSAIDRSTVKVNNREAVDREMVLHSMSVGEEYDHTLSNSDMRFFWDIEVLSNKSLMVILFSIIIFFGLYIATFYDPAPDNEGLVLIGGGIITYFCIQPYLLSLPDWRIINVEEADALLHSSISKNKILKVLLTMLLCVLITGVYFFSVYLCTDSFRHIKFAFAMLTETVSLTFPMMFVGIYSNLPFQAVQIVGSLPFLLMIFFSTSFAPGAGIPGVKGLRFLFSRFYFWCIVPGLQDSMEGCPADNNLLYMGLTSILFTVIFLGILFVLRIKKKNEKKVMKEERISNMSQHDFTKLQEELYGTNVSMKNNMIGGSEARPTGYSKFMKHEEKESV